MAIDPTSNDEMGRRGDAPAPSHADGMLSLVGTPIGNLGDISERARKALSDADVIFCEDTRVTGRLLSALGIDHRGRLERLDENMLARGAASRAIDRIGAGSHVAFCSDAGMPAVSDPGQRIVEAARESGCRVEVIPGPSALDCAIAASGIAAPAHHFVGFPPRKEGERRRMLESLSPLDSTIILYESPKRVCATLDTVAELFPAREVAVCRELTKLHEEVIVGDAVDVSRELSERDGVKGEFVIVVGPPTDEEREAADAERLVKAEDAGRALLAAGADRRTVISILREGYGVSRNEAYSIAHPEDVR